MNNSLIAVRYAKALYVLSVEKNITESIYKDIIAVDQFLSESTDLQVFLTNPIHKPSQKKKIISEIWSTQIHLVTLNFLNLVIDQKRESMIKDILRDFRDMYRAGKNIKNVTFISATPLADVFQHEIETLLQKAYQSEIELHIEVKEDLLGGFILVVDGKLMDASLSNQIKQIKKQLIG